MYGSREHKKCIIKFVRRLLAIFLVSLCSLHLIISDLCLYIGRMSPVKELSPIDLTERGAVTKIYGRAFVAGALPIKVSAEKTLGSIQLHKSI